MQTQFTFGLPDRLMHKLSDINLDAIYYAAEYGDYILLALFFSKHSGNPTGLVYFVNASDVDWFVADLDRKLDWKRLDGIRDDTVTLLYLFKLQQWIQFISAGSISKMHADAIKRTTKATKRFV